MLMQLMHLRSETIALQRLAVIILRALTCAFNFGIIINIKFSKLHLIISLNARMNALVALKVVYLDSICSAWMIEI